jgi:hypothetical protein
MAKDERGESGKRDVARDPKKAGRDPHHALNNPAADPDPTEYPDPYETRPDPRDPAAVDTPADPADPERTEEKDDERAQTPRAPSTSEPHPPDFDEVKPEKGGP